MRGRLCVIVCLVIMLINLSIPIFDFESIKLFNIIFHSFENGVGCRNISVKILFLQLFIFNFISNFVHNFVHLQSVAESIIKLKDFIMRLINNYPIIMLILYSKQNF